MRSTFLLSVLLFTHVAIASFEIEPRTGITFENLNRYVNDLGGKPYFWGRSGLSLGVAYHYEGLAPWILSPEFTLRLPHSTGTGNTDYGSAFRFFVSREFLMELKYLSSLRVSAGPSWLLHALTGSGEELALGNGTQITRYTTPKKVHITNAPGLSLGSQLRLSVTDRTLSHVTSAFTLNTSFDILNPFHYKKRSYAILVSFGFVLPQQNGGHAL